MRWYECGRVFSSGVRPGLPSRDAADLMSTRFGQSAETRRRHGCLRMVFPGARFFRAPIWWLSGGGGAREAGSTVAESLVALYRVDVYAPDSARAEGRSIADGSGEC